MPKSKLRKQQLLYVITDKELSPAGSHVAIAQKAIAGGADIIQLREKNASSSELYKAAGKIRRITENSDVIFIVNDRIDIALACRADGVHLGQDDIPAGVARNILGPDPILGVSARSVDEAEKAENDGADYIGAGPIFEARSTKSDAGHPAGLSLIQDILKRCSIPVIAIGGINLTNVRQVVKSGASGVAIISAIVSSPDIEATTRQFKTVLLNTGKP